MPIVYRTPVPSAQIKSAVLLAGLAAPGETTVIETEATRDHTERMLEHFGADVTGRAGRRRTAAGSRLQGEPELAPAPVVVPADPSSAAFPAGGGADRAGLGRDPRRRDDQSAAHRPDHDAARDGRRHRGARSCAARAARRSPICACGRRRCAASRCRPARAPSMIDEYPVLAVAAAFAAGHDADARAEGTAREGIRPARRRRRRACARTASRSRSRATI